MQRETLVTRYLTEVVCYGGLRMYRHDVERHLDDCGVTGPARLTYGRLPALPEPPDARYAAGVFTLTDGTVLP